MAGRGWRYNWTAASPLKRLKVYIGSPRPVHQVGGSLADTQGEGQDGGRGIQSEDIPPVRLPGSLRIRPRHSVYEPCRDRLPEGTRCASHPYSNLPHPGHPGRVRPSDVTLKAMVAPYLKERHTTWDEKLQELLFDMNAAVQTSTGMSPALSLYGRLSEPPGTQRRLQCIDAESPKEERG